MTNTTISFVDTIIEKLHENHIYAEVFEGEPDALFGTASIFVQIYNGDLKHEHIRAFHIIKGILGEKLVHHFEEVTESDGSDTYSAIHEFVYKAIDKKVFL